MTGAAPEGSQFDARLFDEKTKELLGTESDEDFFTSYDEVYDSFDAMGLQENVLRAIYAYGFEKPVALQLNPESSSSWVRGILFQGSEKPSIIQQREIQPSPASSSSRAPRGRARKRGRET